MSISECCVRGFDWNLQPTGQETTLANHKNYVTGTNTSRAILFIHDGAGWRAPNSRGLANILAKQVDATVYLPDFFDDKAIDQYGEITDPIDLSKLDIEGFLRDNNREKRQQQIITVAQTLRSQYTRLGVLGHCYGGWGSLLLGSKTHHLVDCLVVAHPSMLTKQDIENVSVPCQIHCPEFDPQFTDELRRHANEVIIGLGVPYEFLFYPGMNHGFASRGDLRDEKSMRAIDRATRGTVAFLREWLVFQ